MGSGVSTNYYDEDEAKTAGATADQIFHRKKTFFSLTSEEQANWDAAKAAGAHLPPDNRDEYNKSIPNFATNCGTDPFLWKGKVMELWHKLGGERLTPHMANGAFAFLDSNFLMKWWKEAEEALHEGRDPKPLPRRQDLPPEAFITPGEIKACLTDIGSVGGKYSLPIVIMSYPWLTPAHPDPKCHFLRLLCHFLETYMKSGVCKRAAVFWDFFSLHQKPFKVDHEKDLFLKGLKGLNTLYAHPNVNVLRFTNHTMPENYPDGYPGGRTVNYMERGWCFAENLLSGLIKKGRFSYDVSGMYKKGTGGGSSQLLTSGYKLLDWQQKCVAPWDAKSFDDLPGGGRRPPMMPADFNKALKTKSFTNGNTDFKNVCDIYERAFNEEVKQTTKYAYQWCMWKDEEAIELAKVIESGHLTHVTHVAIGKSFICEKGFEALHNAIVSKKMPNLVEFQFYDPGDAQAAFTAKGCKEAQEKLNIAMGWAGPKDPYEGMSKMERMKAEYMAKNKR